MNVLIINIDHHYRSVYTGMIAAGLIRKIPSIKITGLISSPNDLLSTTGLFKELHFIDTEGFFKRTKNLTTSDVENQIKDVLSSVNDKKWDVVINLSSNLLGSILASFIEFKEIRGTYLDNESSELGHSDRASFLLSGLTDHYNNFFHFTFLYRTMLKRFESVTLSSVWKKESANEFFKYFEALKAKYGKTQIVFIDARATEVRNNEDIDFYANLYQNLNTEDRFLPILLVNEFKAGDALIQRLKEIVVGEAITISSSNDAQLSILSLGSVVITDDLYIKSVADLGLIPSIFLSGEVDLHDYSVTSGSYQVVSSMYGLELSHYIPRLCDNIVFKNSLPTTHQVGLDIYQTQVHEHLPALIPVTNIKNSKFASWWLGFKFLAKMQKLPTPKFTVDKKSYKLAILQERQNLAKKSDKGIYSLAMELSKAKIKTSKPLDEKHVVKTLDHFFMTEESGL